MEPKHLYNIRRVNGSLLYGGNGFPEEEELSLQEYWLLILQHWQIVAGVTFLALFFFGIYAFTAKPIYAGKAAIDVRPERLNLGENVYQRDFYYKEKVFIKTQMEVARSQAVAEIVVQLLGKDKVVKLLGLEHPPDTYTIEQVALKLKKGMEPNYRKDTLIIDLKYLAPSPIAAATLANAWAKAVIEYNRQTEMQMSKETGQALVKQIEELQKSIAEKERRLAEMAKNAQIQILDKELNVAQERLDQLYDQLLEVQKEKIEKSAELNRIQQASPDVLPEIIQNPAIEQLRIDCEKAKSAYREKLEIFKEGWSEVQKLKAQMRGNCDELQQQIKLAYQRLLHHARLEYEITLHKEKQIQAEFDRVKKELERMNEANRDYLSLKAELKIQRETLTKLQEKIQATKISESGRLQTSSIIRIVEYATPSKDPVHPKKLRLMGMGAVLGVFSGVGLVFLITLLDTKIRTHEDLQRICPYRFLTVIPERKTRSKAVYDKDERAVRHAIKFLMEHLTLYAQKRKDFQVLMITSPQPKEGKTFVAANLAIQFALNGRRVLLIDTDIHNPSIHTAFYLDRQKVHGLRYLLAHPRIPHFNNFKWFQQHKLCIIPVESRMRRSGELSVLLEEERFVSMLDRARNNFDYIILDSAPVNVIPETIRVAQWVDGLLLVVRADFTTKKAVEIAVENLEKIDAHVVGIVLNGVDLSRKYSYYNYYYYNYMYEEA